MTIGISSPHCRYTFHVILSHRFYQGGLSQFAAIFCVSILKGRYRVNFKIDLRGMLSFDSPVLYSLWVLAVTCVTVSTRAVVFLVLSAFVISDCGGGLDFTGFLFVFAGLMEVTQFAIAITILIHNSGGSSGRFRTIRQIRW
jgi:hypothetical protein